MIVAVACMSRRLLTTGLPVMLAIVLALTWVSTFAAYAQSDTPVAPSATVDTSSISADQVNEIARSLWCPLCSGVRLDACELKACEQMKEVIAIKLAEGEDLDTIRRPISWPNTGHKCWVSLPVKDSIGWHGCCLLLCWRSVVISCG
ncbi:MAG: hypothetical protein R2932_46460 [Caldilineaceae bacterium]